MSITSDKIAKLWKELVPVVAEGGDPDKLRPTDHPVVAALVVAACIENHAQMTTPSDD